MLPVLRLARHPQSQSIECGAVVATIDQPRVLLCGYLWRQLNAISTQYLACSPKSCSQTKRSSRGYRLLEHWRSRRQQDGAPRALAGRTPEVATALYSEGDGAEPAKTRSRRRRPPPPPGPLVLCASSHSYLCACAFASAWP